MFFSNKNLVAIDIGSSSVKLAELDLSARGAVLKKFAIFPLNPGAVNNGEIIEIDTVTHAIRSLMQISKSKRKAAATCMWGSAVIVKKIAMPKMDVKLVAEQLKWEAEQYIPFDINEISLEHHILKSRANAESMDVLLIAAKQEYLFRFLECFETAQVKCEVMDITGFALANCFNANYGEMDRAVALINFGAGVCNFVVVEKGEVTFCRDVPNGGSNYTSEISKSMGISYQEAEALKISASLGQEVPDEVHSIIKSVNEQLVEEIKNSFEFYAATANGITAAKFYISGGSLFLPGLVEQISKVTGIPFEPFDPFIKISFDSKVFTHDYIDQIKALAPIALGLVLRKAGDR
jgi:type IV pilus assembly protein PilM